MSSPETTTTFESVIEADLATLDFGIAQKAIAEQSGAMSYREAHELYLAALKEEVDRAPAITDRKTREQVQRIRTRLVSIRTGLDKRRKALFAPLRALKEQVDAYVGTGQDSGLQARVKALEQVLEAKEAAWDQEQERIRQEALRIQQERSAARWRELEALAFRFIQPGVYLLGNPGHPLCLSKPQAEVDAMNDDAWQVFLRGARHNSGELAKEKQADERFEALLAAGMHEDPQTGHAVYTLLGGVEQIVTREYLHDCSEELYQQQLNVVQHNEAALKRAKEEEHEAMRRKFEEQAAKQRQMDEDRERLDLERAALKEEKRRMRRSHIVSLGAFVTPMPDGLDAIQYDEEDAEKYTYDLPNLSDAAWLEAIGYITEQVALRAEERAEKQRRNDLNRDRALVLLNCGATRDEVGTWTLGNATTTDKLLGEMDAENWEHALVMFQAEQNAAQNAEAMREEHGDPEGWAVQSHVDTDELLACAMALLDEANKCQTIAADDLDDDECEQMCVKIVAHASDCVKLVREHQQKRKP